MIERNSVSVGASRKHEQRSNKAFSFPTFGVCVLGGLGNRQNRMSTRKHTEKQTSKLVCLSLMICFTGKTIVSRTKESRKVVQNDTMFPLVSRFFHFRHLYCISLSENSHNTFFKYTLLRSYPFIICEMK